MNDLKTGQEDNIGRKKEFASEIYDKENLLKPLNPKELPYSTKITSEIADCPHNLGRILVCHAQPAKRHLTDCDFFRCPPTWRATERTPTF